MSTPTKTPTPTPVQTPPPAATPPTPVPAPAAAPEPPEASKLDPFTQEILTSIGKVVGPDDSFQNAPVAPAAEPPARKPAGMTLGEHLAEQERTAKEKATPADAPAPEPAPGDATPPAPAPAAPAPEPPKLKKKTVAAPAPAPAPLPAPVAPAPAPPVSPAPPTPADPDAAFIAQLDEDQKSELEMAAYAENKFPELKGRRAETLSYFKKIEEFTKAKPDATQEEVEAVIAANRPKWQPGQKRKVEQTFITEEATRAATEAVRSELEPKIREQQKRIQAQELAPVIDKAVDDFRALMSSPESLPDATMSSIPDEVGKRIAEVGYEKASKEFKVEAPIFASADNCAREWMRLTNGLTEFNPQNQTHKWLLDFVTQQGRIYAAKPESVLENGKRFMPLLDHLDLARTNPGEAAKYYTFNDQDVLNMLALNANIAYNAELSALEAAGFKREKKNTFVKPQNPPPAPSPAPTPAPAPSAGSPRMKAPSLPGAAAPAEKVNPNAAFFESLVPGSSQRIGVG